MERRRDNTEDNAGADEEMSGEEARMRMVGRDEAVEWETEGEQ